MSLKIGILGTEQMTYIEANCIPFVLKFRLSKLRKARIIFERDEFGRIVHLQPPIDKPVCCDPNRPSPKTFRIKRRLIYRYCRYRV